MKRTTKKIILAGCAVGYIVAAGLYVFFILAVGSWGGAWCDSGSSCGAAAGQSQLSPAEQALLETVVVGLVLLIAGIVFGKRWLSQPKNSD